VGSGAATFVRRGQSPCPANRPAVPSTPGYILQADAPNGQKALRGERLLLLASTRQTNQNPIAVELAPLIDG